MASGKLYGEDIGCMFEAWQVSFFIIVTGYSLGLIAYIVRLQVTSIKMKRKRREGFILKCHIVFWISGIIFATGACIWPGKSRMNSSGTYCIPAFELPFSALFFFGCGIFLTVIWLVVQYLWIYIYVYKVKQDLNSDLAEKGVKQKEGWEKHFKLARQLFSLVLVYFIFYTPFLASAIYEWTTGYFAPAWVDAVGVFVHIASVANPIIYLWSTHQMRDEISRIAVKSMNSFKTQSNLDDIVKPNQLPEES
jgi:hypothetical protein